MKMKILVYSPAFPPQIGGLEEVARITAVTLAGFGHDVTVVCETKGDDWETYPFEVMRAAPVTAVLAATRRSDAVFMFNLSLKGMVYPIVARKPLVVCHQGWYESARSPFDPRPVLKLLLTRLLAVNVCCSKAVAMHVGPGCFVVPNCYEPNIFRKLSGIERDKELLFVGRLVSDKGCDALVQALKLLSEQGLRPKLTITGAGPEAEPLRRQVEEAGLSGQVSFTGPLRGVDLARSMNSHRVLVVPSLWNEPFGIVALEGIACGCIVIGSSGGGLGDAIGSCGLTFPNGDAAALAHEIKRALMDIEISDGVRSSHLERHQPVQVVRQYEELLRRLVE